MISFTGSLSPSSSWLAGSWLAWQLSRKALASKQLLLKVRLSGLPPTYHKAQVTEPTLRIILRFFANTVLIRINLCISLSLLLYRLNHGFALPRLFRHLSTQAKFSFKCSVVFMILSIYLVLSPMSPSSHTQRQFPSL